jgi:hypothetical protein
LWESWQNRRQALDSPCPGSDRPKLMQHQKFNGINDLARKRVISGGLVKGVATGLVGV